VGLDDSLKAFPTTKGSIVTCWNKKRTWPALLLALVFAWGSPALAKGSRHDEALERKLHKTSRAREYRVIVEAVDHRGASSEMAIRLAGGKAGRKLSSFPGQVALVTARQLEQLERHPLVSHVYLDRPTSGEMNLTSVLTGARTVQTQMGYDGAGIGVAVVDSGVASWHDDLTYQGSNASVRVVGGQRVAKFVDFVNGARSTYDDHGHGTHVAGIIAGNGYDTYGARAGIAPAAHLVSLKVLDERGGGYISNVIAAIDWMLANKSTYNIRVANLSVGAAVTSSYWNDPLTLAAKRAVEAGIVVVAAAGNLGKNAAGETQYGAITAPGNAPWVLTVGAYSSQGTLWRIDDVMAGYSSRGPSAIDYLAKPDLVAPGTGIVSLAAPGSTLYSTKAAYLLAGTRSTASTPYLSLTGTSMAAPVVAGTVALMVQANPSLTPNAVKAILQYTAQQYPQYNALTEGAGFLNSYSAVQLARYFRSHPAGSRYPTSYAWSKQIIWGNQRLKGGVIMPNATAWALNIVWGTAFTAGGDNIVWGTSCGTDQSCDNIVWGTDVGLSGDNIVWGTLAGLDGDNIVWGTSRDGDNIVWGTLSGDNIVWGTLSGDNIVWGTLSAANIVWGTDCGGADCLGVVWGTARDGDNIVWGTAADGDNIVWGTAAKGDNIVWGTSGNADNIVWGTSSEEDQTWGLSGEDEAPLFTDPVDLTGVSFETLFDDTAATSTTGIGGGL
jgi:serine protease AprX